MVSPLDSVFASSTFTDKEIAELFSDTAEINALVQFEQELARVQESLGIIPEGTGHDIFTALDSVTIDPKDLAQGYLNDGIPIPALLNILREKLEPKAANYLHYGATSQDALDTGLILRIKPATKIIQKNLSALTLELCKLAESHIDTVMIARTRNQNASPTVFALKVVNWLAPLQRQQERLTELIPRLLVLQLGGAVGTNAALGKKGTEVSNALSKALDLTPPESPWHAQRDSIVEFANWLSLTAGQIGKIAQDMLLMAQSEVGEISFSSSGKSSTMPNKANPVLPETLLSLAHFCRNQAALIEQTLIASHERDGVSMSVERLALAPLICAATGSIIHASHCLSNMTINKQVIHDNIIADRGLIMAEAAVFKLITKMKRSEAAGLVSQACALSMTSKKHMIDELRELCKIDLDWDALKLPENYLGNAIETINKVLQKK